MKTRAEIEARIRADNPTSDGNGPGHPDYEALVARWVDAAVAGERRVPRQVQRRQLFRALNARETPITRSQLKVILKDADEDSLIDFEEAQSFERDHPLVLALAAQLGLSEAEVDEVFRLAEQF